MATLKITFYASEGDAIGTYTLDAPDACVIVEGYEILANDRPLIRGSFSIHGENYHTICSRNMDDEVTTWPR